jgi:hypothetical protein
LISHSILGVLIVSSGFRSCERNPRSGTSISGEADYRRVPNWIWHPALLEPTRSSTAEPSPARGVFSSAPDQSEAPSLRASPARASRGQVLRRLNAPCLTHISAPEAVSGTAFR